MRGAEFGGIAGNGIGNVAEIHADGGTALRKCTVWYRIVVYSIRADGGYCRMMIRGERQIKSGQFSVILGLHFQIYR